ncbi:MAG: twin-arginine translocase TatA/TatE family subunit [Balneolaceae bacterium]
MGIGGFEWVLIVLAILLLFGAKRIPELARGLGQGIKEFRKASDDIRKEIDRGQKDVMDSTKSYDYHEEPRTEDKESRTEKKESGTDSEPSKKSEKSGNID